MENGLNVTLPAPAPLDAPGEEALAERAERNHADAKLFERRNDLVLGLARPERVLALQRRHGLHRVRPANGFRSGLRQAEEAHLAGFYEVFDDARDLLHRHVGIDPVLVVEVDIIRPEPLQAALDRAADLRRLAVDAAPVLAGVLIDVPTELGGDFHLVAHAAKRLADHLLVGPRAVGLGGVEEIHAKVGGLAEKGDHFGAIGDVARFAVTHRAERERRDLEPLAERAFLHFRILLLAGYRLVAADQCGLYPGRL
jgi:hypothetical protein